MTATNQAPTLPFETYLAALRKTPLDQKTEHTDRTALETLLGALAPPATNVQHEPKHQGDKGSPDFKVTTSANAIIGYVEVKTINENLDRVLKSDQITKYKTLSENIILTDYLQFIWINGQNVTRATLAYPTDLENRKHKIAPDRAAEVAALIANFFSVAPAGISRAQDLANALATRAHLLRDGLNAELLRQEAQYDKGRLYGLLGAFRTQVFHELTLAEFADAFAQMLAYGLFLARLNTTAPITLANARDFIPAAFPLIRELIDFTKELNEPDYAQIRWIVEEILSIMNSLDLAEIRRDLSFANRKATMRKVRAGSEEEHRLFERDPFVYFYEDFLAKYDAKLRKSRGVYYTPPPVVNFIIRAIDDILKTEFAIPTGLADHKRVTLLDFATGTGTFLLEAFERMFETVGEGKSDLLVREHILKNVFGFEYLIAPYTIAHLKLSQYLADKGHKLAGHERLQIYLTNTLEPIEPQNNFLLPALSAEAEKAQEIKKRPILVITGNPPYSGESKNKGAWISKQINTYKYVDGAPLGEKNPKWLSDDYVKFIRFAQDKMDQVQEGVVGIITNHSFLDNPTFRGMRQSLMATFDQIYVLDLHGNAKKKEKSPDGTKDENVFDIEQGVAISILIKTHRPATPSSSLEAQRSNPELAVPEALTAHASSLRAKRSNPEPNGETTGTVKRADLWGARLGKYESTARLSLKEIGWRDVAPRPPFYLFETGNAVLEQEYLQGFSVPDIFPVNSVGIVTARDDLAIQFERATMLKTVQDFAEREVEDARRHYKLGEDVRDWKVKWAQEDVVNSGIDEKLVTPVLYRPFDRRWTYYTGNSRGFLCNPRENVMRQILQGNIVLGVGRAGSAVAERPWELVTAFDQIFDANMFRRGLVAGFPLYIFPFAIDKEMKSDLLVFAEERENISLIFRSDLGTRYDTPHLTPEQVFGYIYAILHAPTYRTRYAEFLRGDFPRIPLAPTRAAFEALSTLGWDLAQKHLLKSIPANKVTYRGKGDNSVEKPRYAEAEQAVYINAAQSFAPVPEPVWAFHIGGYQVIEKYLKSRKGRTLTLDEVTNVENIVAVLAFTITQMAAIDTAYQSAFPTHA